MTTTASCSGDQNTPCRIAAVMAREVVCVAPTTSMQTIAQHLAQPTVAGVVITPTGQPHTAQPPGATLGLITEADVVRLWAQGQPLEAVMAEAVMTPVEPLCAEAALTTAYARFQPQGQPLPVVSAQGEVVGILAPRHLIPVLNPPGACPRRACDAPQRALRLQRDYNYLITAIISRFVDISPSDLDGEIEHTLKLLGEMTQTDASALWFYPTSPAPRSIHRWCRGDQSPCPALAALCADETQLPWSHARLRREEMLYVPDVARLDDAAAAPDQAQWQAHQIQSLLLLPLVKQSQVVGAIGIAAQHRATLGTDETIQLLQVIGQMIVASQRRIDDEQRLLESEERLRLALSATSQGLYDINLQTGEVLLSPEYATMLGYDPETFEETDEQWLDRLHPDDHALVTSTYEAYIAGRIPEYKLAFRRRTQSGDWKWVLSLGKIVAWDEAGQPLRLLGTHTDIDAIKRTEASLRASEARFRAFIDNSPMTAWINNPETHQLEYASQSWRQSYTLPSSSLVGQTLFDLFPADIATLYAAHNRQVVEQDQAIKVVEPALRPDHTPGEFLTFKFPLHQPNGQVLVGGVAIDITEHKRADQRLALQSAILGRIVQAEPLTTILNALVLAAEDLLAGGRCAILFCGDDQKLHAGVAPHLPASYSQALEGTAIGEAMGSCGTAVVRREPVIVEDIATDPLWQDLREIPLAHGLRACWSVPVFATDGPVLATFAVYHGDSRRPYDYELDTLKLVANLAKIAIEQDQSTRALERLNRELEHRVAQRTAALQRSRARLREAQQMAHLGSWEMDRQTREFVWSEEILAMLGVSGDDPLPSEATLLNHFVKTEWDHFNQLIDRVIATGEPGTTDLQYQRADGAVGYFLVKVTANLNEAGNVTRIFGIAMDVTDRRRAQAALQRSEERARATLMALPDLVFRVNREGIYLDFMTSPQSGNLVNPQVAVGKSLAENLPANLSADHVPRKYQALHQALATQTVQCYEQQVWLDGQMRYEEVRVAPCGDQEAVFFIRDISDRKQAEQELMRSRDLREAIFNESTDALFLANSDTLKTLDCNQRAVDLFEAPSKDALIGIEGHCLQTRQFTQDELQAINDEIAATGFWCREIEYRTLKGKIFWGNIATKQITITGQKMNLVRVTDISPRKQVEADLHRSNQELARATRMKDEFLANMSHELRTPLNAILGMAEGLEEKVFGPLNPRQIKALKTIERSGAHLLELINDILDLAKIEAGQIILERAPTPVTYLCQSSLTFIQQEAQKKKITLATEIPAQLPDLWVDERRIRQVLINLFNNAVKFTPEGGTITLSVMILPPEPDQSMLFLRLAITDTGIGIAESDIARLFQPFVQIDSALNRQFNGTGLGLALVKQIMDLHGGQVAVTSKVGVGSCFTLDLPCVMHAFSSLALPLLASHAPAVSSLHPRANPLILLAEDNEANIHTVSSYLGAKGYRLLLASTGQLAIELAKTHQPDLILMDIQMPDLDGVEATRQIRSDPDLAHIPIIALTALAMPSDRDRCLAVGVNDYLSKPVKLKQLANTIQQFLDGQYIIS